MQLCTVCVSGDTGYSVKGHLKVLALFLSACLSFCLALSLSPTSVLIIKLTVKTSLPPFATLACRRARQMRGWLRQTLRRLRLIGVGVEQETS